MTRVWFTADTHFGHANIIKYCQRPFLTDEERQRTIDDPRGKWRISQASVDRHDHELLDAINRCVQPRDTLWILGDFCWGDFSDAKGYRDRIRCEDVRFVWGNHDRRAIAPLFSKCIEQGMIKARRGDQSSAGQTRASQNIWLNHYPMRSWDKAFHGSWHLYGHVHGRLSGEDQTESWRLTRDVGVDACGYMPISFDDLCDYMQPRILEFEKHKLSYVT